MDDRDCVAFLQWCLPRLRLRWAGFRKVRRTVCKRARRRLRELGLADLDAYRAHLEAHADEWPRLDALCRIPISRFYRDRAVFDALGAEVLPALAARAAARGAPALRCWSAGCASGEEPFSLRLAWDFRVRARFPGIGLSILATDADEVMLARAARACYPAGALKDLPPGWRARAFEPADGLFRLRAGFRAEVTFQMADIRENLPDGPFDLVLCRNLAFTYFEPALQAEVLQAIARRLGPGGVLVLGAHERPPDDGAGFVPLTGKLPLYRQENGPAGLRPGGAPHCKK